MKKSKSGKPKDPQRSAAMLGNNNAKGTGVKTVKVNRLVTITLDS